MITEITVGYGKTKNLGNFESLRIDVSLSAKIQEGDDFAAIKKALQVELKQAWQETYNYQYRNEKP